MKKIIYFFAIFASLAIYAQQKQPLVLVDGMLASEKFIQNDKNNIDKMNVYKTASNIPKNLKNFENLASAGIISVDSKEKHYDRISLEELNRDYNLAMDNPVYFDGKLINDTKLKVVMNALENMEVKMIDGKKFLSLYTTTQKLVNVN